MVAKTGKDTIGYIVMVTTPNGYGGNISIALGVDVDGTVAGTQILTISETPGLGMNATNEEFMTQFSEKKVPAFVVTKTGAKEENEIDALSGATITTNAVTNGVNAAIHYCSFLEGGAGNE